MWPFVSNKHIKKPSTSFVIREMETNRNATPCHTPWVAITKKTQGQLVLVRTWRDPDPCTAGGDAEPCGRCENITASEHSLTGAATGLPQVERGGSMLGPMACL